MAKTAQLPIVTFAPDGSMRINTTNEALRKAILSWRYDEDGLEKFCKFFFKASFKKPFNSHRRDLARRLSDPSIPRQWMIGSRGIGKTTLVWGECIRRICFRLTPFLLYVSSDLYLAERRTESIKSAILNTPRIRQYFGKMSPAYVEGMREAFGTKSWKLTDPLTNEPFVIVVPKSAGTTVNGLLEWVAGSQQRPHTIVCDDMTDRLRVWDEVYRSDHKEWAMGTLFPCVDNDYQPDPKTKRWPGVKRGELSPWQIMIPDTCKHSDDFVDNVAEDADWVGRRYPIAEETEPGKFKSLVENYTDEQVQAMYNGMERQGKAERFYKEFLCIPGQGSETRFPDGFQYYREEDQRLNQRQDVVRFIIMDPARTQNARSAYTAMLAVAVDCRNGIVWLRKTLNARISQEDMASTLLGLAKEMNTEILCVEDAGLNDHIRGPLERYAHHMGRFVHWIWLPTQRKFIEAEGERRNIKECRASSALWLYRSIPSRPMGCVFHEESLRHSDLEQQMKSYPECKYWDALDCLGHVDYVMRELGLTFESLENADPLGSIDGHVDEWDEILDERSWCYEMAV